MVAEAVDLKKECYFAILQDRARECPVIVASTEGGMDIEEVATTRRKPLSANTLTRRWASCLSRLSKSPWRWD